MKRYLDFVSRVMPYKNRTIVIWGAGVNGVTLYKVLVWAGLLPAYFIDCKKDISSIIFLGNTIPVNTCQALVSSDKNKILVIVAARLFRYVEEINCTLEQMGYEKEKHYLNYMTDNELLRTHQHIYFDPFLGWNYKGDNEGFQILGSYKAHKKILVLGNCTSSHQGEEYSWIDFFFERIEQNYSDWMIYNGASDGYSSSQELLKLIRDGLVLRPDLVICLNGIIDASSSKSIEKHPYITRYEKRVLDDIYIDETLVDKENVMIGLDNLDSRASVYMKNIMMMKAICESMGIAYECFLQPSLFTGKREYLSSNEASLFEFMYCNSNDTNTGIAKKRDAIEFYDTIKLENKKRKIFEDLSEVFSLISCDNTVYNDEIHYTYNGYKMISNAVFEYIELRYFM